MTLLNSPWICRKNTMSVVYKNILDSIRVSCESCGLNSLCIPRGLNENEIEKLDISITHKTILRQGDTLYKQNSIFTGLYAVKSGALKIININELGEESVVGIFLPGEIVGFDGFSSDKHQCTVSALETSHVCKIQLDEIQEAIPNIYKQLLKHASNFINDTQAKNSLIKTSAEKRIIAFLLDLSKRHNERGYSAFDFNLYLSRSNIANLLHLSPETVSRTLRNLERTHLIKLESKRVKILNMTALTEKNEV